MALSYDEFLNEVALTHEQYVHALKVAVTENRSAAEVFIKRDCCDVFTNNYNENILKIHRANMDLSFILDEYACVSYILGYITKNESGLSRLMNQIENESATFGRCPRDKVKLLARALDASREISRPEAVYRMLGLHYTESTRTHEFIQTGHPNKRDGLLRS